MSKRDQRSSEAAGYRHLYNDWRWRGPHGRSRRQRQAQPLCEMCLSAGKTSPATVADHVIPHRGDEKLFFEGKLQSLCDPCHASRKQAIEVHGFSSEIGLDGLPSDPNHPFNR